MAVSPFDSSIYRELLHDDEVGRLFSDGAEIGAMMQVEGALAKVQGDLGVIPEPSAREIFRLMRDLQIEPASLAVGTGQDGVPVPALLSVLRDAMHSHEHAQYLHWGATSQDIMDTGLVLRLRGVCSIVETRLMQLLHALADQAEAHAELPMAARTRMQVATPTSFGAVIAAWGAPLLTHLEVMAQLKQRLLQVSLAGASGNSTVLGTRAAEVRALLAAELGLATGGFGWHNDRSALTEFASLLTRINASVARIGEDYILAVQSEVGELRLASGGGSSTMPQKSNPVTAEVLVGLFRFSAALGAAMTEALLHRQQRDGAAWSLEWHALPQICMAGAKALAAASALVAELRPNAAAMSANLEGRHGLVYAEAISFRLARIMPRPDAQAEVKSLCKRAVAHGTALPKLAVQCFPDIDWCVILTPSAQLGDAPDQARAFTTRVREL